MLEIQRWEWRSSYLSKIDIGTANVSRVSVVRRRSSVAASSLKTPKCSVPTAAVANGNASPVATPTTEEMARGGGGIVDVFAVRLFQLKLNL